MAAEPRRLRRRQSGVQRRSVLFCIAASLVVIAVASGCSSGKSGSARRKSKPDVAPVTAVLTPKQAAIALGRRMVGEAVLTSGAKPVTAAAPAVPRGPSLVPAIGNLVVAHRAWTVDEAPYDVYQWLQRHRPRGFEQNGTSAATIRGVKSWEVSDKLSVAPANVSSATLEFGVTAGEQGGAVVRVDSVVGWTAPRPASEFVSTLDRVVTVTGFHLFPPGSPDGRHVTTTDPKLVAPIVRTFNGLRVQPPKVVHGCPMISGHSVGYRIAFATSRTAKPDIVATLSLCGGVGVKVHGRVAPTLDWIGGESFTTAAVKVLGLSEPHFN